MKVLKDAKYLSILDTARNEFIKNGFKDASMRIIAKKANVGLSNIYNYFKNKDDIFTAVVAPVRNELFDFITRQHKEDGIDFTVTTTFGHNANAIDHYIELIDKNKATLRILLFNSQGSSMENFRNELTDHITNISYEYLKIEKKHFPDARPVSRFFIHTLSSWMVSCIGEIIIHDLGKQDTRSFFREFFQFEFAGWKGVTGI